MPLGWGHSEQVLQASCKRTVQWEGREGKEWFFASNNPKKEQGPLLKMDSNPVKCNWPPATNGSQLSTSSFLW